MMSFVADSGVSWRPIHSTKSPSGSALLAIIPQPTAGRVLTHQIKVNAMVDQVILAGLDILRGAEVHAVHLAHMFYLLVRPRQADDVRMELVQIPPQNVRGVSRGVAGDEDWLEDAVAFRRVFDPVDDGGHFIQFVGADIRAMREAEIDLPRNHQ